jgi:hypothetical protein
MVIVIMLYGVVVMIIVVVLHVVIVAAIMPHLIVVTVVAPWYCSCGSCHCATWHHSCSYCHLVLVAASPLCNWGTATGLQREKKKLVDKRIK